MNTGEALQDMEISSETQASDDLGPEVVMNRQALAAREAGDRWLRRLADETQDQLQGDISTAQSSGAQRPPARAIGSSGAPATAGAVAGDVGRGLIETPRSIAAGVRNAAQEVSETIQWLSSWAKNIPGPGIVWDDENGIQVLGPQAWREWKEANPEQVGTLPELPEVREPESVTGGVVKSVSQFLTGFIAAGATAPLRAIQPASTAGRVGKAMAQGAASDFAAFDPHEARLANLIQDQPALQNPVTNYLASSPGDGEAEGRFKNALEGLGLGALTEGMFRATKAIRAAQLAKREVIDGEELLPTLREGAFKQLGDIDDEALMKIEPPAPKEVAARPGTEVEPSDIGTPTEGELFINFARIDSQDDVKAVMQNMADTFKTDIDQARRGDYMSFKQMELNAEQVNAFDTLMARRTGEPLNAEQSIAARQLWATSADKLAAAAREAAENPSEANLFAFRKMTAVHDAIQQEVIAARTETARALASWRIPAGGKAEQYSVIEQVLQQHGGNDVARRMAQDLAKLSGAKLYKEMDKFAEKSAAARTLDAVTEAWVAGLLSGPKTHMVNAVSNTAVAFQQMAERAVAARIAQAMGDEGSVKLGEATAQYFGMVSGLKDGILFAAKSFRTGESGYGLNKIELPQAGAISSEALRISSSSWLGRTVDVMGTAARVPFRSLTAADEFFKTVGYRMELNALALRQAGSEINASKIPADQLKSRVADILENPPESLRLSAINQASYQTFTNETGWFSKNLGQIADKMPLGRVLMPFVRTPANIMKYTFQRTPLAPLMKEVRVDIAAGGARRDLALARISTGTSIMLVTADMAMNEQVTGKGPSDASARQAMMRNGWQPYSVKMGDRYYAYNRMDPLGMTMGLAADMVEILANDDYGPEKEQEMEEVAVAVAMSIANNVMNKTYLSGISGLFEAMSDPERYGDSWAQRLAGSAVPAGVAEVARFQDPYMREANSWLEAIQRRTPGLSESLPPRRDIWGQPISYQSGIGSTYDALSPIYSKQENPSPIDSEILRLEASINMPPKKTSFNGVTINLEKYPAAYSRYVQLAGNELKHPGWGLGAKDLLDQVVSGRHGLSQVYQMYSDGPDGGKADFIKKQLNDYRTMARRQLLNEFLELRNEYEDKQLELRRGKISISGG